MGFDFGTRSNGWAAPERAQSLDGAGPQNELVVEGCDGGSHEWPNPKYPLQNPPQPNPFQTWLEF